MHGTGQGDFHCTLEEVSQSWAPEMAWVVMVMLKRQTREQSPSTLLPERINEIVGRPVTAGLTGTTWTRQSIPWTHPGQGVVSMTLLDSLEPRTRALGQREG